MNGLFWLAPLAASQAYLALWCDLRLISQLCLDPNARSLARFFSPARYHMVCRYRVDECRHRRLWGRAGGRGANIAWEAHLGGYFFGLLAYPFFERAAQGFR